MVLTDMKEQVMHQILYNVDILIHPLIVLNNCNFVLGCCGNCRNIKITE